MSDKYVVHSVLSSCDYFNNVMINLWCKYSGKIFHTGLGCYRGIVTLVSGTLLEMRNKAAWSAFIPRHGPTCIPWWKPINIQLLTYFTTYCMYEANYLLIYKVLKLSL